MSDWTHGTYSALDSCDAALYFSLLTEDVCFRIGNAPALSERQAACDALAAFFASVVSGVSHSFIGEWRLATGPTTAALLLESRVTYTRKSGEAVEPLPATSSFRLSVDDDGQERAGWVQVYADLALLMTPPNTNGTTVA